LIALLSCVSSTVFSTSFSIFSPTPSFTTSYITLGIMMR
jgi:hypothetical protein